MSDEIDPSIAALLSETEDSLPDTSRSKPVQTQEKPVAPSFQFNYEAEMKKQKDAMLNIPKGNSASLSIHEPDLSRKGFCEITKFWEDEPNPVFDDKNYDKTVNSIITTYSGAAKLNGCVNAEKYILDKAVFLPMLGGSSYAVVNKGVDGLYFAPAFESVCMISGGHS